MVSWIQHTSNAIAASALAVAENAQKLDISPTLEAFDSTYSVVAGLAKVSKQLFTDFDDVASFMPRDLSNWMIQGENWAAPAGHGTAPNQTGLFETSGTLTRQYDSTGGEAVIDTVLEAVTDVREGGAYAQADLILLHPTDWLAMRKLKTSFNSYVLDPNDPNTLAASTSVRHRGGRQHPSSAGPRRRTGLQNRGEHLPPLGTRDHGKPVRRLRVRVQPDPLPS